MYFYFFIIFSVRIFYVQEVSKKKPKIKCITSQNVIIKIIGYFTKEKRWLVDTIKLFLLFLKHSNWLM